MRRLLLILPLVLSQTLAAQSPRNLEGVWNYATLTPFERPAELGAAEFFTDAQAAAFEALTIGRNDRDRRDGGAAPTPPAASPTTGSIAASTSRRSTGKSAPRG